MVIRVDHSVEKNKWKENHFLSFFEKQMVKESDNFYTGVCLDKPQERQILREKKK
jgi:hypothetical protein